MQANQPSSTLVRRLCFLSLPGPSTVAPDRDDEAHLGDWRRIAALGFGVAVGLEPAERAALGWSGLAARVRRAGALALSRGFLAGASSEPLPGAASIPEQLEAVAEQAAAIEAAGGMPLLLPLAALARRRAREDEYVDVYRALLARLAGPVLVDWTGPHARPELAGYFPGRSFERVMALDPLKVRGARLELGDVVREARLRRALAGRGQLLFTADRTHLGHLLLGANPGPALPRLPATERSTALAGVRVALGDFSHAILSTTLDEAEALAAALGCLEAGDATGLVQRLAG